MCIRDRLITSDRVCDTTVRAVNMRKYIVSQVAVESIISLMITTPGKSRTRWATVTNLDTFQQDTI